jgi:hypothetical protein
MVAGVALFLLGPVYLSPQEWNSNIGVTPTHVFPGFGLRVGHIDASCSLWRCGLRQNDCVISINGSSAMNLEPRVALALFLAPPVGEPLTMHVLRGLPGCYIFTALSPPAMPPHTRTADICEGAAIEFDVLMYVVPRHCCAMKL